MFCRNMFPLFLFPPSKKKRERKLERWHLQCMVKIKVFIFMYVLYSIIFENKKTLRDLLKIKKANST